jgi:Ca2+-binding EF-hand superfamily protein
MTGWKRKLLLVVPIAAVLAAQTDQVSKQKEKNLAAGEAEAKRLVLLMDRDQNGKVSKDEFMKFMDEEFTLLDVNKDGQLDVREMMKSRFTPHTSVHR